MSDPNDNQNPDDTSAENFAALRGQNDQLQRELAFAKAGIDTESKQGKVLMQTFDGKLDADAIRAYRDELFGASTPTTPEPAADPAAGGEQNDPANADPYAQDVASQQAMRDALAAGQPGQAQQEPPQGNVYDEAAKAFHADRKSGVPQERAAFGAIDRVISAAAEGNADVLLDPYDWERQKAEAGHTGRPQS